MDTTYITYQLDPVMLSKEEIRELVQHRDDPAARTMLIRSQLKLAVWQASKLRDKTTMDWDDLRQEAVMALIDAVDKYDPDKGAGLTTYATIVIQRKLTRLIQEYGIIRYAYTCTDRATIIEADAAQTEDGDPLWNAIAAPELPARDKETAACEYAMSLLDEREQAVMRYAYLDKGKESIAECAEKLGISVQYVAQIKHDALRKLRAPDVVNTLRDMVMS